MGPKSGLRIGCLQFLNLKTHRCFIHCVNDIAQARVFGDFSFFNGNKREQVFCLKTTDF